MDGRIVRSDVRSDSPNAAPNRRTRKFETQCFPPCMRHDDPFGSTQEIQALQRRSAFTDLWSQTDGLAHTSEVRSSFSLARAFFAEAIFLEWVSGIHASGFPSPVPFSCSSRQTQYVIMTFALAVLSLAGRIRQSVRRAKLSGALDACRIADPTKFFGSGSRTAGSDVGSDGFFAHVSRAYD
ncbi:hypothetical protein ISCGN_025397 [Ixodes scapularis]